MRILFALLFLFAAATPAAAQKIYKCPKPGGGYEYTNTPCDAESEPLQVRDASNFGGSSRSAEMRLERTACINQSGYPKATGWVVNATNDARTAYVKATFLAQGQVAETTDRTYTVAAFGRTPYEIIGPSRQGVDSCLHNLTWD